jgi:hypothetical protein
VHDAGLGGPDLGRVVLDPAGLGKYLPELLLSDRVHGAVVAEQDRARARGSLIERKHERHVASQLPLPRGAA